MSFNVGPFHLTVNIYCYYLHFTRCDVVEQGVSEKYEKLCILIQSVCKSWNKSKAAENVFSVLER